MFTSRDSDSHWERYGRQDPYFGVISLEQYKLGNMNENVRQSFFASGKNHIEHVLKNVRVHYSPEYRPHRALDFGCGVGRLVLPLSALSKEVVGIDISTSMIEECKRNCSEQNIANVTFYTDLKEVPDALTFDLIHSFIVFQHIPVAKGELILRALIDRLAAGGIGVLHFTYHAPIYARIVHWTLRNLPFACNIYNLLLGRRFTYPVMQSNFYSLNRLFQILQTNQCNKVYSEFTVHKRNSGVTFYFQKELD